jgi:NADPH-dependent 2,4-dienoyl-CoA reductase/sulfur reductase-like enzyme
MDLKRRTFLGAASAASALLAAPMLKAQGRPRVVVIGGGAGGATVARYLANDSAGAIDVTLVEPTRVYFTCFFSNLFIGGFQEFAALGHTYDTLAIDYGVNVVHDLAVGVDRDAKTVTLGSGSVLPYDRLVLSPGIDFVEGAVPGWSVADQDVMPHAYKGGTQAALLRAQIDAMPQGGTYVMVAPPNPYRCPPGPYERISMVAHRFTEVNPTAKIIIVDPKETFSKQALFEEGWQTHYPGMIERIGPEFGAENTSVNVDTMEIDVDGEIIKADVANVIPAQRAGNICQIAGVNDGNWAPVVPASMQSRIDPNVYVLGDSSAQGDMPKSGYSANSQAKVASMIIRGELTGSQVFPARYSNTCWSLIATDDGVKVGASYEPTEEKIASVSSFISETGEDAALRKQTYEESLGWYAGITSDMFG